MAALLEASARPEEDRPHTEDGGRFAEPPAGRNAPAALILRRAVRPVSKDECVSMGGCWLYILRCADGSYYVGTSRADDLETRISQHNQGLFAGYTSKRRPVVLAYSAFFDRITEAIASERQIKGWSRVKKEALIRGDFDALPALSKRKRGFVRPQPSSFETPPTAAPQDEG